MGDDAASESNDITWVTRKIPKIDPALERRRHIEWLHSKLSGAVSHEWIDRLREPRADDPFANDRPYHACRAVFHELSTAVERFNSTRPPNDRLAKLTLDDGTIVFVRLKDHETFFAGTMDAASHRLRFRGSVRRANGTSGHGTDVNFFADAEGRFLLADDDGPIPPGEVSRRILEGFLRELLDVAETTSLPSPQTQTNGQPEEAAVASNP